MNTPRKQVLIYTDGGCDPNPGPGGYGVVLLYGPHRKELANGYRRTTNNRMEIMAAIAGLELLNPPCEVTLFSDSEYLVNAMRKGWASRWRANQWRRADRQPAANPDLWETLLQLCERHTVTFEWLKGHAGDVENERCDQLAMAARLKNDLLPDPGYPEGGD
jgi:ribonuclease HI